MAGDRPGGSAGGGLLERPGRPLVQRHPPRRRQFAVYRVPDQRVREGQPRGIRDGPQHAPRHGPVEQVPDPGRGKPRDRGEERRVDPLAEHARRVEQVPDGIAGRAQLSQDQLPELGIPGQAVIDARDAALHDHPDEQRVPAGPLGQPPGQPVGVTVGRQPP